MTFGLVKMISVINLKAKKGILSFFYDFKDGHFCSGPNSKGDILQKALTFIYRISQFDGHSTQCSQLTIKAVFARLRKLQCFSSVESCTTVNGLSSLCFRIVTKRLPNIKLAAPASRLSRVASPLMSFSVK